MLKKYLIIDRDGTLIHEPEDDFQVDSLEKLRFLPESISSLKFLKNHFELVMFTNQDGLGTASFPQEDFDIVQNKMLEVLASEGITFSTILICPHKPEDNCNCRKPEPKLMLEYLYESDLQMDKENSFVFGDRESDEVLAKNLGIKFICFNQKDSSSWKKAIKAVMNSRKAKITRETNETNIQLNLDIDGDGSGIINTGLPFFDHMLDQLKRFSKIDLTIEARGDLEIEAHHLIEDVAIVLGKAIRKALGNKFGIERYAFMLPMDEANCQIALDLSGRFNFDFEGQFTRQDIEKFPTEMLKHFFYSLCEQLALSCQIKVYGENDHHKIESIFKTFGKCLNEAMKITSQQMMSTKGMI